MNKNFFIIVSSIFAIFFLAAQACNFGGLSTGLAADCVGSGDIVCDGTSAYECSLASYGAGYTVTRAKSFDTVNCGALKADCEAATALGATGEAISFDGSASTGVTTYSWDFDGDGVEDSANAETTYSYSAEKKYTATLTVADSSGNTDSCEVKVTVKSSKDSDKDGMPDSWEDEYGLNPNDLTDAKTDLDEDGLSNLEEYQNNTDPTDAGSYPAEEAGTSGPTAVCSASATTVGIKEKIDFVGSGSTDDGTMSYVWDFGAGSKGYLSDMQAWYGIAGSYTATLTVTDNDGNTGSCSIDITVTEAPIPLVADCGGPYVGTLYHNVSFDGSASTGDIASYFWDFGDSSGTATSTQISPLHIYGTKGNYTVTLKVTGTDTTNTCTTTAEILGCRDSDSGFNYTTKGTATGTWYKSGTEGTWTDSCNSVTGKLQEYTCMSDAVYTKTVDCSTISTKGATCSATDPSCTSLGYICSDGACVAP